jgi:hypothetical protein
VGTRLCWIAAGLRVGLLIRSFKREGSHKPTVSINSHSCVQCRAVDRRQYCFRSESNMAPKGDHCRR